MACMSERQVSKVTLDRHSEFHKRASSRSAFEPCMGLEGKHNTSIDNP